FFGSSPRGRNDKTKTKSFAQLAPHHVERLLAGEPADAFTVAGKIPLHDLGLLAISERVVDEADGLLLAAAAGAGNAGDADAEAAGAGLRRGYGDAAHIEVVADDLLERFSGTREQVRLERVFEFVGEAVNLPLRQLERLGAAAQMDLHLAGAREDGRLDVAI